LTFHLANIGSAAAVHESIDSRSTGFMSATGVPSIASIGPILTRLPTISRTVTRCSPSGFGLSRDRVEKMPVSGELLSPRRSTFSLSRRASCNQVTIMISSPTTMPCNPSSKQGLISSQASGAPSGPCRGASPRHFKSERMNPIGSSEYEISLGSILFLLADVTKHIRVDVQTDVGHVVKMFAANKPDDLADRAFGIVAGHAGKSFGGDLFIFC
jgi:hypothetical protein